MSRKKLFYPDRANYRRFFVEEREQMLAAVREADVDVESNLGANELFYEAWCQHPSDDASRMMRLIGADEFSRLFSASLQRAKTWIQSIIRDHLNDLATVIDPIDEVASGGAPDLAGWARGDLGILKPNGQATDDLSTWCPIADRWGDDEDLIIEESLRVLTLASKMRRLEAVDSWEHVTQDMTRINMLGWERLWVGRKVVLTINYAVYKYGDKQGYVHPNVPLTFGAERAGVPWDAEPRTIAVKCRVVQDGETVYLVLTKSRPKGDEETILKELEKDPQSETPQCRVALDRRGIMHVLVAVGVNGRWRAACADDNEAFAELVRARLWKAPLFIEKHVPWENPESNPAYRRVKIIGRFHRKSYRAEEVEVRASVEHQIIAIETMLSSMGAQTTLNHDIYRGRRIRRVLIPELFKGNFSRLGLLPSD